MTEEIVQINEVDPRIEEAQKLIGELDEYQTALYPAESNHLDGIEELTSPNVIFVMAYLGDQAVGCGAVKDIHGEYGEIKRVYVSPKARGIGLAKGIMAYLEAKALARGIQIVRLETGIHQIEALRLYEKLGYKRRGPFGSYTDDPLSIYLEKRLIEV
jgi:putative acetyltransferase